MSPMNVGGNNDTDGCLSQRGIDLNYKGEILKVGDDNHTENVMNAVWQAYRNVD
jgi:hypothetical protein